MSYTPPQTTILDAVAQRLALITVANGYHYTVRPEAIRRASLTPFRDGDLPGVNYWPSNDTASGERGAGWVGRSLDLVIEIYSLTNDRPFSDVSFELANDVGIAMLRAPSAPLVADDPELTLGGLVRSTQLLTVTPQVHQGQAPWCGAAVLYTLAYRVSVSNPSILITS